MYPPHAFSPNHEPYQHEVCYYKGLAFSAKLGQWDTIETQATPALSKDTAVIVTADSIAVFSAATGKWAIADTSK